MLLHPLIQLFIPCYNHLGVEFCLIKLKACVSYRTGIRLSALKSVERFGESVTDKPIARQTFAFIILSMDPRKSVFHSRSQIDQKTAQDP